MTREIRQRTYRDGRARQPKRIDHGHTGRKIVFYTVCVLVLPLALIQVAAAWANGLLEIVGTWVTRLRVWSHPCLYGRMPKQKASLN